MKKLDKKMLYAWYLGYSIPFILTLIAYILSLIYSDPSFYLAINIIFIIFLVLLILLNIFYPYYKYKYYSYSYDDKTIRINKGIVFKKRIMIPVCQIQDLHLSEGPLMQILKLGALEISTAGSNYIIAGINSAEALNIIEDMRIKLEARLEVNRHEEIH